MQRHRGEVVIWHPYVRWGFATASGQKCYIHESNFRDHRQVALVHVGAKIEFDLPSAEKSFADNLNEGRYRDDPTIVNHRNPRRVIDRKPKAKNIAIVEEAKP
jgi:hypothetical protein